MTRDLTQETFCGNGAVGVPPEITTSGFSYLPCSSGKPIGFLRRAAAMIWMSVKTTGTKRGAGFRGAARFLGGFFGDVVLAGAAFFFVDGVLGIARFGFFAMRVDYHLQRHRTRPKPPLAPWPE